MNYIKSTITFLLCLVIAINFMANITIFGSKDTNLDFSNLEFKSNFDFSENEFENEKELKNLGYLLSFFNINNIVKVVSKFSIAYNILSHRDFSLEVPTSPPNNC
jgi:hypothetical protein